MFYNKNPTESVGLQVWAVYTQWHSEIQKILKPVGINHTQFVILASILWCLENQRAPTQTEIVQITSLDKMTLSKSLKILVSKELVTKVKDERDSRSFVLSFTSKGDALAKKSLQLIEDLDQEYFGSLGDQKHIFISLLQQIRN